MRAGIYSLSISIAIALGLLYFSKIYAGSATYVMPGEKGVYWSNLLMFHPVFFTTFSTLIL